MVVTGLFDIYALLFGIFGGIIAELGQQPAARAVSGTRCSQTPRRRTCGAPC